MVNICKRVGIEQGSREVRIEDPGSLAGRCLDPREARQY
jgi:hypothetical protein